MEENQVSPITPETNPNPEAVPSQAMPGPKDWKKLIIKLIGLVVIVAAAWFAYTVYASPGRVWQKFTAKIDSPTVFTEAYSFSYQDNGKATGDAVQSPMTSYISNIKFSATGNAYVDNTDTTKPQSTLDMSYSFGSGDTSLSSKMQMVMKDQNIYINPGDNPLINTVLTLISPGQKIQWIKLDMQALEAEAKAKATGTAQSLDMAKQVKEYQDILQKHLPKLLLVEKNLGKETLHGVETFHYSNKLNKDEAKALFQDMVNSMVGQMTVTGALTPLQASNAKSTLNDVVVSLIDNEQITTLETWIGAGDYQLHKIKFAGNAPSLISLFSQAMAAGSSSNANQDPQKLSADILKNTSFEGQLAVEEEFYDFGKAQAVTAPTSSFDLYQKIKQQQNTSALDGLQTQTMP